MADVQATLDLASSLRSKTASVGPDSITIDPFFEEDPEAAKVITFGMKRRKNIYIVGPTGCGKSSLVINLAAKSNDKVEIVSMDGETCKDDIIGKLLITEQNGQAVTSVAYGPALRAYSEGKILLLEEVDMANPDILAAMHRMMELQSGFVTVNIGTAQIVKKHVNFMVIATANTIGWGEDSFMYAGTKPQNQAFMNRFSLTMKMDYLPADKEAQVVHNKTGIDLNIAKDLVNVAGEVRTARNSAVDRVASVISTRDLLELADAMEGMGVKAQDGARITFLNRMQESDRDIVQKIIDNRF
jgi:cobaltochelatase CobS